VTRQIALLTNPTAGTGQAHVLQDKVVERLVSRGMSVDILAGRDGAESVELARKAVADGVDSVVAVGGDGLVHAAVQALAGSDVRLGVIPSGTGNDFARSLGLPQDPLAAADVVALGQARPLDLGRSGESWFATVMAAGFDAAVNERANAMTWPHGQLRYTVATLAVLPRWQPVPYTFDLDGEQRQVEAMLVCVANTDSYGGGLRIPWGAEFDDGLLDVIIIRPTTKLEFLRVFPQVRTGGHVDHPAFERVRATSVTVAAPGVTAYADGERFGALPLTVECVPGAVSVLT